MLCYVNQPWAWFDLKLLRAITLNWTRNKSSMWHYFSAICLLSLCTVWSWVQLCVFVPCTIIFLGDQWPNWHLPSSLSKAHQQLTGGYRRYNKQQQSPNQIKKKNKNNQQHQANLKLWNKNKINKYCVQINHRNVAAYK